MADVTIPMAEKVTVAKKLVLVPTKEAAVAQAEATGHRAFVVEAEGKTYHAVGNSATDARNLVAMERGWKVEMVGGKKGVVATPEGIVAALGKLTPEDLAKVRAALGPVAAAAKPPAKKAS